MNPISNYIVVRTESDWDSVTLGETGVKLQVPTEYNAEVKTRAASWDKEKHAPTSGVVVAVPERIIYEEETTNQEAIPWKTTQELRVGDTVIFNYLQELHAVADGRKLDNGDTLMQYEHVICAIREEIKDMEVRERTQGVGTYTTIYDVYGKQGHSIIPVNGYIIVEALPEEEIRTKLIIPESLKRRKSIMKGTIRYIGTPLAGYRGHPEFGSDVDELKAGDEIIFHKYNAIPLQNSMHQIIDKEKTLYMMQRIDVDLYRRYEKHRVHPTSEPEDLRTPWRPCSNRVLVKYDPMAVTREVGALHLVIPENQRKFPDQGTVVSTGCKIQPVMHCNEEKNTHLYHPQSMDINDKVYFFRGCGTPVTLDNEDFIVLKEPEIGVIRKQQH